MRWALAVSMTLGCADPALRIEGDAMAGRAVWDETCALCHGVDGQGTSRGGSLIGVLERERRADVLAVVRFGTGAMPGQPQLDDEELADLLAFLATL